MVPFAKIRWVKSVTLDEETFAYGGTDPTVRAREPRQPGDVFDLHCTEDDAESLAEPPSGELIVLVQHDLATHLARIVGDEVVPRPRRTVRPGTRDARFSRQRACELLFLRYFDEAPTLEDAFGFSADVSGGEVFSIAALPAFERSDQPLWAVQRRVVKALEPERRLPAAAPPAEGPLHPVDQGPGRVRRTPK